MDVGRRTRENAEFPPRLVLTNEPTMRVPSTALQPPIRFQLASGQFGQASYSSFMMTFPDINRVTMDPAVMGGKPCIRGTRVTVGTITGLLASGAEIPEVLELYPYLTDEDVRAALSYAAWRSEEREIRLETV